MNVRQKSGPVYSNVSLIKRALFQSPKGKLPFHEILVFVNNNWTSGHSNSLPIDQLVGMALNAPRSFFEEDENGLWGVKYNIDQRLDEIYQIAHQLKQPFLVEDFIKKFSYNIKANELVQGLHSDIRFTDVGSYWLLLEWELINDLVFEYMQKIRLSTANQNEIVSVVRLEYQLDEYNTIFAPHIDTRFIVKKNHIQIELEEENEENFEIIIPVEVKEEVARSSVIIFQQIRNSNDEVRTRDIIPGIFNIKANNPAFKIYYAAVEEYLALHNEFICIAKGRWIFNQAAPALDIESTIYPTYSVKNSVPTINNLDLLMAQSEQENYIQGTSKLVGDIDTSKETETSINSTDKSNNLIGYSIISYFERIKGYLQIPFEISYFFKAKETNKGKIEIIIDGFTYDCWWGKKDNRFYFYGNGIYDFFSDYLIEPGHRLRIELKENQVKVDGVGIDERYASEQARYLDIGRLVEESRKVNKSIFTLICEILSTYPSGMHWTMLVDKVSKVRTTTKNTVYNLLSKNECFQPVVDKKGYWKLNILKLSRFYVDEEDKQVEVIEEEWNEREEEAVPIDAKKFFTENPDNSNETTKDQSKLIEMNFDEYDTEDYELPSLWSIFYKWSNEQKNVRFQNVAEESKNKEELIENITNAYSEMLCNVAKSRATYSIDRMDLVQEGFFGLLKAIKKFDGSHSFAHYSKRWVLSKVLRYIDDQQNLIRQPAHMVEKIRGWEKLVNDTLLLKGRFPTKEECLDAGLGNGIELNAFLRRQDYVTFEQFSMYLRKQKNKWEQIDNQLLIPWYAAELIDEKTFKYYYDNNIKLKYQRSYLDFEEDSDLLWGSLLEFSYDQKDLRLELEKLLNQLDNREREMVMMKYGFMDDIEHTLEEIGRKYNLTRERVRQIIKNALAILLKSAIKNDLATYLED
ncbi:sigma-70 family RNA polymerase sigma factor [Alkalihalobacterium sp. APHAB7]|uniref:sigma-70 family RNA polymerase sigma factor n=1 Tax=Alkalihalobacterium sp. APHAB7 TaxID=3402081 RepID=UPI003AAD13AB